MYKFDLSNIKRPVITEENKQFFCLRYISRSFLNLTLVSIVFRLFFKKRYNSFFKFSACYYMGFSLRKINNFMIESHEEKKISEIKSNEFDEEKNSEVDENV